MRDGQRHAQRALGLQAIPQAREVWGWKGRTLSQPVTGRDGRAWLRLACAPADQTDDTFWDGALAADRAVPPSVPRPRLRTIQDWTDPPWKYRAELYDMARGQVASSLSTPTTSTDLPNAWWTDLRAALERLATVTTDRSTIRQRYIDYLLPRYLGVPIHATATTWTTAHGDLHPANLCAPTLQILDWEGWGLAPAGYDAATLYVHSLAVPTIASRVRHEFGFVLETPSGRYAELVAIAELLHGAASDENVDLIDPLHQRAQQLLDSAAG
jgi:hypothetical protein